MHFPTSGAVVPGAGAFEVAVSEALDLFKSTVASRARLGVKVRIFSNIGSNLTF